MCGPRAGMCRMEMAHAWGFWKGSKMENPSGLVCAEQVQDSMAHQLAVLGSTPGMSSLPLPLPYSRRDLDINRPGTVPNAKTLR